MSLESFVQRKALRDYRAYLAGYLESAASLADIVAEDFQDNSSPEAMAALVDLAEARLRLDRVARMFFPMPLAPSQVTSIGMERR